MKKILFMFGMYKPKMSPNGICCEQVMKEFVKKGYDVWCVVNQELNSPVIDEIDGIHIHRIKPRLTYRMNEYCEYNNKTVKAKILLKLTKIISKFKLFITLPIWPMVSPLYSYRFYKKAKELYKNEHFNIVIGIYTPIDSLWGAHMLKNKYKNIQFIAYFLDSLSGGFGLNFMNEHDIIERGKKWEKILLSNVDKVIVMEASKEHHQKYNRKEKYFNKITYLDIPLLVKERQENSKNHFLEENKINIVFTGRIKYPIRNPKYIIALIEQIESYFSNNVNLYFIGENNCKDLFDSKNDRCFLKVLNQVSHADAVSIMNQATILLNLGTNNPSQTPCKIIEYMSIGKPIINTYNIDNDPGNTYLKKYPTAILLDEREEINEELKKKMIDFISSNSNIKIEFEEVEKNFYKNTPCAFVNEIEKELRS